MSTVTATELPLTFNAPPGWPAPTDEWLSLHQGWEPEPEWAPTGAQPRPAGWKLWTRNQPVWNRLTAPARASLRLQIIISIIGAAVGVALSVGAAMLSDALGGSKFVLFYGLILWPIIVLAIHPSRRRRIDKDLEARVVAHAEEMRRQAETVASPAVAASASAEVSAPAAEEGDATGESAQSSVPLSWDTFAPVSDEPDAPRELTAGNKRAGRVVTIVAVVILGGAAAFLIPAAMSANASRVDFTVREATNSEAAAASQEFSDVGGWVFMVTLDRTCDTGTPVGYVDFGSSDSGKVEDTRQYDLKNVAGTAQPLAVDGKDLPAYAVLDKVQCSS